MARPDVADMPHVIKMLTAARVDASLSAYETTLRWFHTLPAADLERRLVETIGAKRDQIARGYGPKPKPPRSA